MDDLPMYTEHRAYEDSEAAHKPKWLGQDRLYRWNMLRIQLNDKMCKSVLTKLKTREDIISCLKIDSNISQEFVNNPGIENAGSALQKKFGERFLLNDLYFLFGMPRVVKIFGNAYKDVEFEGGFTSKEEYENSIHENESRILENDFPELGMSFKSAERGKFAASHKERTDIAASRNEKYDIAASRNEKYDIAASRRERDHIAASRRERDDIAASRKERNDIAASRIEKYNISASRRERDDIAASRKERNDIAASRNEKYDIAASRREKDDIAASRRERDDIAASRKERDKLAASRNDRNRLAASRKTDELRNSTYDYPDLNFRMSKRDTPDDRREKPGNDNFGELDASRRPESSEYQLVIRRRDRDGDKEGELRRSRRRDFDSGVESALWQLDKTIDEHY